MNWKKIVLSGDQATGNENFEIRNQFGIHYFAAGVPHSMALFSKRRIDGSMEIYFSPRASHFAQSLVSRYEGVNCNKPRKNRMSLLAGHPEAIRLLN